MQLTITERLLLGSVLQSIEGNAVTLRVLRDLQAEVGFNEEECARYALNETRDEDGKVTSTRWKREADDNKDIDIGPVALKIIQDRLGGMDARGKLTLPFLPLYERFVAEPSKDGAEPVAVKEKK